MRLMQRGNVDLKQETLAIGAVNWHMIDASGTPDQSLRSARVSFLECRVSADDEGPSNQNVQPRQGR